MGIKGIPASSSTSAGISDKHQHHRFDRSFNSLRARVSLLSSLSRVPLSISFNMGFLFTSGSLNTNAAFFPWISSCWICISVAVSTLPSTCISASPVLFKPL
ncbi:hypothetical protein HGRIS_009971 [Hohenbuehelia grisea]|uniref:Uncharacterized protein n=1 Tax=Hohenbuehelia grisea TaxID=104357 RepID=A0ABR3J3C5_9AGAR